MAVEIDLVKAVTSADPDIAYRDALDRGGVTWSEPRSCWMAVRPADVDVARRDPPVQNTRRYAAESMRVGGASIEAGDTILVGLAAASLADDQRSWSFGAGRHACPGRDIAMTIAVEGVLAACEAGLAPETLPDVLTYRPLGNARIPQFVSMDNGKGAE